MTVITLKLTPEELDLLTALASDQLFRRQYIEPRLPGYKHDPAEVKIGMPIKVAYEDVPEEDIVLYRFTPA